MEPITSIADHCAIRHAGGDVYAYLFPLYVRLGYAIYAPEDRCSVYPTVCFIGDGATGKIISYAISLGHPNVSLFNHGIFQLKSKQVLVKQQLQYAFGTKILPKELSAERSKLELDCPRPSMDRRMTRKTSMVNQDEIGYAILKYLYDWSLDDHTLAGATGMDINCALRLIDSAIVRFNKAKAT